jgi:hypothetical protein
MDTGANVSQDINSLAEQYLDVDKKLTIGIKTQIASKVRVLKGIKGMLDMVQIRTSTRLSSNKGRSSGGNSNSKSKSIKKSIKKYRKHYVTKRKNLKQYRKRTKYNQRKYRSKRSKRNN